MKINRIGIVLILILAIWSCKKNDDPVNPATSVAPRPLTEVAAEDDIEIQEFLRTHFFNYEDFETPLANFDFKIKIDTIDADNADKIPLLDQVETITVNVSAFEFLLDGEENVPHKYYYLEARKGKGIKPTIADSTFVNYKALLLDGEVFDEVSTGTWWDNPSFQFAGPGASRSFRGVAEGVVNIASGTEIIENDNGTFGVNDSGIGMIIFPSALSTFNGLRPPIPQYSPLIFQIEVLTTIANTDHDNDGIPSIMENEDGDGIIVNDDTDGDRISNYLDTDDDNDGTLTIDEDLEPDEDLTVDRDGDGDKTNDVGDGNPLNDDTDGDGIPNYLDTDDTASRKDAN